MSNIAEQSGLIPRPKKVWKRGDTALYTHPDTGIQYEVLIQEERLMDEHTTVYGVQTVRDVQRFVAYPADLVTYVEEEIDLKQTAQIIRAVLKAKFPGVKFSVKTHRNTRAIDVEWTNGSDNADVVNIVDFYRGEDIQGGDGMGDSIYAPKRHIIDGKVVIYDVLYISAYRNSP